MPNGFFLKKKPPRTPFAKARLLWFRSGQAANDLRLPLPVGLAVGIEDVVEPDGRLV
jgi:hypothetical protein